MCRKVIFSGGLFLKKNFNFSKKKHLKKANKHTSTRHTLVFTNKFLQWRPWVKSSFEKNIEIANLFHLYCLKNIFRFFNLIFFPKINSFMPKRSYFLPKIPPFNYPGTLWVIEPRAGQWHISKNQFRASYGHVPG